MIKPIGARGTLPTGARSHPKTAAQPAARAAPTRPGAPIDGPRWFADPALQARLDRETHSIARGGNAVELLVNGVESQPRHEQNIAEADLILLKTYNWRDDQTGHEMVEHLEKALARGAEVFIQFDVKGAYKNPAAVAAVGLGSKSAVPEHLQRLVRAGAALVPTNVPDGVGTVLLPKDHEKYLITWKRGQPAKLIMGGENIGDEWRFGGDPAAPLEKLHGAHGFRDNDAEVRGPATRDALAEFVRDVAHHAPGHAAPLEEAIEAMTAGSPAGRDPGSANVRFVSNRPSQGRAGQDIERLFCTLLSAAPAGQKVFLSSAFFLPTDAVNEAIVAAARRGVKFELLLNSTDAAEAGFRLVAAGAQSLYRTLLKSCPPGTLRIFEWHGDPERGVSSLHQKLAAFGDDGPVLIGSSNLDFHSLAHNSEGVILVQDAKLRARFDEVVARDLAAPGVREVTEDDLARVPPFKRIGQWFVRRVLRPLI